MCKRKSNQAGYEDRENPLNSIVQDVKHAINPPVTQDNKQFKWYRPKGTGLI